MTSTVFQFLVAAALVMAWIWMLGRPLLTMLARRSRRDSVGQFRSQQAALGRSIAADGSERLGWWRGVHPVAHWRAQPLGQRRLQVLLGSAIAAFASLLLAIALRGLFIRLFLVMAIGFVLHLLVAALIGARELRALEATAVDGGRSASSSRPARFIDDPELFADRDPRFAPGFFDPIPEFETRRERPVATPAEPLVAEWALDEQALDEQVVVEPVMEPVVAEPPVADPPVLEPPVVDPPPADRPMAEPTFTTPAPERSRPPRRPRARPIFIESDLDEGDDPIRVVND